MTLTTTCPFLLFTTLTFQEDICIQAAIETQMFWFIARVERRKQHLQQALRLTAVIQKMFTALKFETGIVHWLIKCLGRSLTPYRWGAFVCGKIMLEFTMYITQKRKKIL